MKITDLSQVGADICESQKAAGFIDKHVKWQNHGQAKVAELLVVPQYVDLLEDNVQMSSKLDKPEEERHQSCLIWSQEGWWKEMLLWIQKERKQDTEFDEEVANTTYGCRQSKWLPHSLDLLFGSQKETDIDERMRQSQRQQVYTVKTQLMELLADGKADEERIPDDGELEGSGDNFVG